MSGSEVFVLEKGHTGWSIGAYQSCSNIDAILIVACILEGCFKVCSGFDSCGNDNTVQSRGGHDECDENKRQHLVGVLESRESSHNARVRLITNERREKQKSNENDDEVKRVEVNGMEQKRNHTRRKRLSA